MPDEEGILGTLLKKLARNFKNLIKKKLLWDIYGNAPPKIVKC